LRTARRRQGPQWMHLVVVAILAAVGGVALWNGLQYSASHGSSLMEQQPVPRQVSSVLPGPSFRQALFRVPPACQPFAAEVHRHGPSPPLSFISPQGLDGSFEEEPAVSTAAAAEQGDEGKSDTHANLKAWTKITAELPGSADGGTGAGGDAAARQGAGAAGGGVAAATEGQGFMTVQLRVPKASLVGVVCVSASLLHPCLPSGRIQALPPGQNVHPLSMPVRAACCVGIPQRPAPRSHACAHRRSQLPRCSSRSLPLAALCAAHPAQRQPPSSAPPKASTPLAGRCMMLLLLYRLLAFLKNLPATPPPPRRCPPHTTAGCRRRTCCSSTCAPCSSSWSRRTWPWGSPPPRGARLCCQRQVCVMELGWGRGGGWGGGVRAFFGGGVPGAV
jgi:hypothetical protein